MKAPQMDLEMLPIWAYIRHAAHLFCRHVERIKPATWWLPRIPWVSPLNNNTPNEYFSETCYSRQTILTTGNTTLSPSACLTISLLNEYMFLVEKLVYVFTRLSVSVASPCILDESSSVFLSLSYSYGLWDCRIK